MSFARLQKQHAAVELVIQARFVIIDIDGRTNAPVRALLQLLTTNECDDHNDDDDDDDDDDFDERLGEKNVKTRY